MLLLTPFQFSKAISLLLLSDWTELVGQFCFSRQV